MGAEKRNINLQYDRAAENQQLQNAWQTAENDKDRLWQEQQWLKQFKAQAEQWQKQFGMENEEWQRRFDAQNQYNDPRAVVARLQAAGINPAAMAGQISDGGMAAAGGSSSPSSPTVASPSMPGSHSVSPIGLPNISGISSDAQIFSSLAQLQDSMQKGAQVGLNMERQQALLGSEIEQNVANASEKREVARQTRLQSDIIALYGSKQAAANVLKTLADRDAAAAAGDYDRAAALNQDALRQLTNERRFALSEQRPAILSNLQKQGEVYQSEIERNTAQASAARSSASYMSALAETENGLRDGRITGQALENGLRAYANELQGMDAKLAKQTYEERFANVLNEAERNRLINRELVEKIRVAAADGNTRELQNFCSALADVVGSITSVHGAAVNQWSAEQKATINKRMADWQTSERTVETFEEYDPVSKQRLTTRHSY